MLEWFPFNCILQLVFITGLWHKLNVDKCVGFKLTIEQQEVVLSEKVKCMPRKLQYKTREE